MDKTNTEILNRAIGDLPIHAVPEICWKVIDEWITCSKNSPLLENAIDNLPICKAPSLIWQNIEKNLNENRKKRIIANVYFRNLLKIAAILIISITVYQYSSNENELSSNEKIYYSKEIIENPIEIIENNNVNNDLNTLINKHCQAVPDVCSSEKYIELNNMLNEIQLEEEKLIQIIKGNNNPQLNKYYSRINNRKLKIQKEILHLII